MAENQQWATQTYNPQVQEHAQRQQSTQPTERPVPPKESVLEQNDQVAERNARELGEVRRKQAAKHAAIEVDAKAFAPPKENQPGPDQTRQQDKQRDR
jgi:hypothetical protein